MLRAAAGECSTRFFPARFILVVQRIAVAHCGLWAVLTNKPVDQWESQFELIVEFEEYCAFINYSGAFSLGHSPIGSLRKPGSDRKAKLLTNLAYSSGNDFTAGRLKSVTTCPVFTFCNHNSVRKPLGFHSRIGGIYV